MARVLSGGWTGLSAMLRRRGITLAFVLVQALCWSSAVQAAVCTSQASGNWSTANTWSGCGGNVPQFRDTAIIANTHTVTANAGVSVGALTVNAGGLLNINNVNFTVLGATNVGGTIAHPVAGSNKNYRGLVTINAGGVWSNASNQAVSFYGGITHNGASFSAGTGLQTFDTLNANNATNQAIGGASPINFAGPVTVANNVTVTNNNTGAVTIAGPMTAAAATSTWVNGANSTLNYADPTAPMAAGILNASANPNTVNYTGAAQAIKTPTASYHHLTLGGSGAKTAAANLLINGNLTIAGSASFVAGTSLTHTFRGNWLVDTSAANPFSFTTASVINFNTPAAAAPTTIGGTTIATLAFNDVNINNISGVNLVENVSFTNGTSPTLTIGAGAKLTPSAAVVISGTGTLTGNGTVAVTRIASGTENFNSQYSITTRTLNNLTVEYAGTGAQTVSALTYGGLTINNASGVTLQGNTTVNARLTLSTGTITTGASTLITGLNCAASVFRTSGHVVGNLRKTIPAGASTCIFEIGTGANYTPAILTFVAGTGAGNITATTTGADHGSLNLSGIGSANSVNRFWTLTTGGVTLPAAGYSARFYFINASPVDLDAGATPAGFIVQRWSGVSWFTATVNATCPATPGAALCKQVSGVTGFGDFAIGEGTGLNGTPGDFNIFETSTPAGAILGRINTKLHNVPFNLDIVRVNDGRTGVNTGYSNSPVSVVLLDARDNTGALTVATNCRSSWTQLATPVSINNVTWTSGRATIPVPALANAAREVRVRVTQGTTSGCSTDRFAIRPLLFTSVISDMTNATNAGKLIKKTGETFRLTASTGVSGYDNAPAIDNTKVTTALIVDPARTVGAVGTVGGAFSPALNGTATSEQFFYSEVGNFTLGVNAVVDDSYTAVDQPNDCTPDFSNSAVGGKFGCNFGNPVSSATIGRFTPDNFEVSLNTPEFATACSAGAFTYVGQPFIYAVPPVITVTARNGTNNGLTNEVTRNYTGADWWKLTGTAEKTYTATSGALAATGITGSDPVIVDRFAATGIIADRGTGTLTFSSGSGLIFTRSTPSAPFNAEIQLSIKIQDSDGVAAATNPVQFGTPSAGIAFSNGNQMRFGRLRLANAAGSELLDMQIPVETQYWSGSAFLRNAADGCTTIAANSVSLTNHLGAVTAANMPQSNVTTGGAFSSGVGVLRLNKPSPRPANKGSVNVCVRLDPDAATVCNAAVSADLPWLQGKWTSNAEFDDDPAARATFGIQRGGPIIYMREMH